MMGPNTYQPTDLWFSISLRSPLRPCSASHRFPLHRSKGRLLDRSGSWRQNVSDTTRWDFPDRDRGKYGRSLRIPANWPCRSPGRGMMPQQGMGGKEVTPCESILSRTRSWVDSYCYGDVAGDRAGRLRMRKTPTTRTMITATFKPTSMRY